MSSSVQDILGGPVPSQSPFYLVRPQLEELAFGQLVQSGSLLRLKAPQKMGKSTLMLRLFDQAGRIGYRCVYLDLQLADQAILAEPDRFLAWFCASFSRDLGLDLTPETTWDTDLSSQMNSLLYLRNFCLPQISQPVVLLLNEVNRLFDYPGLAQTFLPLLRSLYETARHTPLLQNLRLVLAYSTEIYVPLKLDQSPFNVGYLLELPKFSALEIKTLAAQWQLSLSDEAASALHGLVGGHPYLVQLSLHFLRASGSSLTELLRHPLGTEFYSEHLQRLLWVLLSYPELKVALQQVLLNQPPDRLQQYRLQSLGIIEPRGQRFQLSCDLYRQYFGQYFRSLPGFLPQPAG